MFGRVLLEWQRRGSQNGEYKLLQDSGMTGNFNFRSRKRSKKIQCWQFVGGIAFYLFKLYCRSLKVTLIIRVIKLVSNDVIVPINKIFIDNDLFTIGYVDIWFLEKFVFKVIPILEYFKICYLYRV